VPAAVAERAGRAAAAHLAAAPEFARCARLVLYAATLGELSLSEVVPLARAAGKRLLWPRVLQDDSLVFAAAEGADALRPGRYGVLEPTSQALEALAPDVLLLIPGVAFDAFGGRLGRGRGIWDRALAEAKGAVVFGVGYELQIVPSVPRTAHDRSLDALLTEAGIRRFGTS
jgi:5-formyltetrahydrofolate cyclo-ligase